MEEPKNSADYESHIDSVSGPVHTGSGSIYHIVLTTSRRVEFDASRFINLYNESILTRPDLVNMQTPLGSVEIKKLYITPRLAPVSWIYGEKKEPETTSNTESPLTVMGMFKRLVVFGSPGIGKSTFLKFLLHSIPASEVSESFPIFFNLYQYITQHSGRGLLTFAVDQYFRPFYQSEELEALSLLLQHWQSREKLVFLLDGLDEVPGDKRESLLGQIRSLPRFVLTSRPRGRVEANQESGANYNIMPFAHNEVARFVRHWQAYQAEHPRPEPFSAPEFFNYIRREPRIADMVRIPQLLTIMCWLWGKGGSNRYGTKGELLAEAVEGLTNKAVRLSGLSEEKCLTLKNALHKGLATLALEMLQQSRLTISREEFIELFEEAQPSKSEELLMLALRSGLLNSSTGREDEFQFIHLVFQEYLAAEALVRHPDFETVLDQVLARVDFEESLRMASGRLCHRNRQRYAPRLGVLLDKIMAAENTDIFYLNWRLAALCLSEVDEPERRLGARVSQLEDRLMDCASEWWARRQFTEAMGRLRTAGMRQRLVDSLRNENWYLRWAAAEALKQMADPATLEVILARIEEEDLPVVQDALARALGCIGDRRALPILKKLLDEPGENWILWQGIGEALGRFEDVETLVSLSEVAEVNSQYGSYKAAMVQLGAHPYLSEEALATFRRSLEQIGASITGGPADAYILLEPTIEELEEKIFDKDPAERMEAVRGLGYIGGDQAIWLLLNRLLDEDEDVARVAGRMLQDMEKDGGALGYGFFSAFYFTLYEEGSEYREATALIFKYLWTMSENRELIWEQGEKLRSHLQGISEDDIKKLLGLLDLGQPYLIPALWTLGLLGDPHYFGQVEKFLDHPDDLVRWVAVWALGELADPGTAPALLKSLRPGESNEILQAACQAVGKLRIKKAFQPLIELLDNENEKALRREVINSLAEINATEATEALLGALKDDDSAVREAAANALGKMARREAVQELIEALQDNNSAVQIAAATALGDIKDQRAESPLLALLRH